ncbi:MAG: tetratricopeptide repeat protein [Bacteroidales bacterium]|nr:tetratricopeptide repeat protein [Bacteroidales bacterium]
MKNKNLIRYIIFVVVAFLAYGDTLWLKYASDDRMIIYENDYTLQGDVKSVMTKDAFTGYFGEGDQLVAGGRYRPLSQLTFMAEYQAFGGKIKDEVGLHRAPQNEELFANSALPYIQHGINVLYFILLCLFIYITLQKIFPQLDNEKWYLSLPFLATLLFLLHPLHTEAVANIKGRDEIMSMIGAMAALLTALKFMESRKWWWLALSFVGMLFGLFSKENAVTFLAVIPLALLFKGTERKLDYVWTLLPALVASAIFIVVRSRVLGGVLDTTHQEMVLNNPFVNTTKAQEIATVLLTWGIYFKLLIFPHPLTHDYYPHQIEITNFSNGVVWFVLLIVLAMLAYVVYVLVQIFKGKRSDNQIFAFGIALFFITFSITSNLLFNIGTFMNERFMFMPLLGFALVVAYAFQKWAAWGVKMRQEVVKRRVKQADTMPAWVTAPIAMVVVFLLLCTAYTGKTAVRNWAWHDDNKLFITDVETSTESMKCNLSAGGSYLNLYKKEKNTKKKNKYLKKAELHLNKALALGRSDTDTWSLLGQLYCYKKDYVNAARCYTNVLQGKPDDKTALENLEMMKGASVAEANRLIEEGKRAEALALAQSAIVDDPNSVALLNILGRLSGEVAAAELAQAENALQAQPDNKNLQQTIQQKKAALQQSIAYLERAHDLDPDYASACENLGIAYASLHRFSEAIPLLERALKLYTTEKDIERTRSNLEMMKQASGRIK